MPSVKIDAKAWFSLERTFLHWSEVSLSFAAASMLLLNTQDPSGHGTSWSMSISAGLSSVCSVLVLIYAYASHRRRIRVLESPGRVAQAGHAFADRRSPFLVASALTAIVLTAVVLPAVDPAADAA
mmetsp:Transcript_81511/g.181472  ORF Transcript_81511/g.181472 Transcript_81511/m.181472 type:complete len:126 (+) Transcript_81511:52-429(+)